MSTLFVIIMLAILVVTIVLRVATRPGKRTRQKRTTSSASQNGGSPTQWRAVKIAPGLICCGTAGKLAGKVFLSRESPQLPLEGCIEKDCRCKYVHLEDRRDGRDRRIELGELGAFFPDNQAERRQTTGRRSMDVAA